jgi:hypothetical protein
MCNGYGFRNLSEKLDSGIQFYPENIHDRKDTVSETLYIYSKLAQLILIDISRHENFILIILFLQV